MKHILILSFAMLMLLTGDGIASDIEALDKISNVGQAESICNQTCAQHECGWAGNWKKGVNGKKDSCDCGPVRIIKIPAGVIRTEQQAKQACSEICSLNESPWTGEWDRIPGAFDLCSCKKIGDWCEPKT